MQFKERLPGLYTGMLFISILPYWRAVRDSYPNKITSHQIHIILHNNVQIIKRHQLPRFAAITHIDKKSFFWSSLQQSWKPVFVGPSVQSGATVLPKKGKRKSVYANIISNLKWSLTAEQ